ncbi:MAG: type II toxin-antitoxin system VapC family toxin [Chloroflexi bacterium]|nr:type II toxin-antitoxin system VapC family toxin [Chloroflexota bacterium]
MTAVVVDASLAIKWVLAEPYTSQARALLLDWETRNVRRLVPALFASEICAPLLKRRRQGVLSASLALQALQVVLTAVEIRPVDGRLAARAYALADQLGFWKAYDCLYLALAEDEGCEVWTSDERLWKAAHGLFPWVRWVGEPAQSP